MSRFDRRRWSRDEALVSLPMHSWLPPRLPSPWSSWIPPGGLVRKGGEEEEGGTHRSRTLAAPALEACMSPSVYAVENWMQVPTRSTAMCQCKEEIVKTFERNSKEISRKLLSVSVSTYVGTRVRAYSGASRYLSFSSGANAEIQNLKI